MKTIKILGIASIAALFAACGGSADKNETNLTKEAVKSVVTDAKTVVIDKESSKVMWEGTMVGMYSHSGTLDFNSGMYTVENGMLTSGKFEVNMQSMTATDENYNAEEGKTPEKLIGHLSSDDFFSVEQFPTASFEVTRVQDGKVYGNLTIKGKTHEEMLSEVSVAENGAVKASLNFDRTKYDVTWDHPVQEMVLSDEIEIKVALKPAI